MNPIFTTYYTATPNVGDLLTPLISKRLFNKDTISCRVWECDLIGIGSILDWFTVYPEIAVTSKDNILKLARASMEKPIDTYVWSTGFLCNKGRNPLLFWHKKLVFNAVRGELSKSIIERITGKILDNVVVGDGGLLSSLLIDKVEKKYRVGFVPHYGDLKNELFLKFMSNYENAHLINVKNEPLSVLEEIASCEVIFSSSLHGLIIADSFGIPNKRFVVSGYLRTDTELKFRDYYSAFNVENEAFDAEYDNDFPSLNQVIDNYKIDLQVVKEKQKQLIDAFPFK